MSEATIEYKNSPNESTAYAVSEGQKTKVQLVATPAGDLELADNPNVDTGYLVINGEKHKCALVAEVAGELKLPTSATDDTGYVVAQDGRQHKVKLVANVTGGGGGEPVEKTKFGVSIDNIFGDVDENGSILPPTGNIKLDLADVKTIPNDFFRYFLARNGTATGEIEITANSVTKVGEYSFAYFSGNSKYTIRKMSFGALEELNEGYVFNYAFSSFGTDEDTSISFPALKKISGNFSFQRAFYNSNSSNIDLSKVFPVLEEVSGNYVMDNIVYWHSSLYANVTLPKVKRMIGHATSKYSSTFGTAYMHLYLPECSYMDGYIMNSYGNSSIHFAAANQAAIEACNKYGEKFGAKEIYFDL